MKNKKTSLSYFLVSTLIIFISFIFFGCKKEEVIKLDTNILTKEISVSSEFREILLNLSEIKRVTTINKNSLEGKSINQDLFTEASKIKSIDALNSFLTKLGYENADEIVKLTVLNESLLLKIFEKFPHLYTIENENVLSIFKEAQTLTLGNSNGLKIIETQDMCSSNYGTGMGSCGDALAWDLVAAGAGGLLALSGTPIASAGTVLTLAGIAYAKEYHCKVEVVAQWSACRAAHPLH